MSFCECLPLLDMLQAQSGFIFHFGFSTAFSFQWPSNCFLVDIHIRRKVLLDYHSVFRCPFAHFSYHRTGCLSRYSSFWNRLRHLGRNLVSFFNECAPCLRYSRCPSQAISCNLLLYRQILIPSLWRIRKFRRRQCQCTKLKSVLQWHVL